MIISLIKNAETTKNEANGTVKINFTGASEMLRNAMMLLHFSGKRPLYSVDGNGNYTLNFPQNPLLMPDVILTGKESYSVKSGEILNEIFSDNGQKAAKIESDKGIYYPQEFLKENKTLKHVVVIGSETCLNKWATLLTKGSQKRTKDTSLFVLNNGNIHYDSDKPEKFYAIEGIMDTILVQKVNTKPETLGDDLKPFACKLKQLPPLSYVLKKIYPKTK